jgi:hypothetical protein
LAAVIPVLLATFARLLLELGLGLFALALALLNTALALSRLALAIAVHLVDAVRAALEALRVATLLFARCIVTLAFILAAAWTALTVHAGYGGDLAATLPAATAALLPAVYGITRLNDAWVGLVFAAIVTAITGFLAQALPFPLRLLLLAGARGAAMLHLVSVTIHLSQEETMFNMFNKKEKTGTVWAWAIIIPLTLFSAFRNYNLIQSTLGDDLFWFIGGLFALFALDGGVLLWKWALDGADSDVQKYLAIGLVLLDLVGALLGTLADTMLLTNPAAYQQTIETVAIYAIPVIIFINLAAGFVYNIADPERQQKMDERRATRDMAAREHMTALELKQAELDAQLAAKQAQIAGLRAQTTQALLGHVRPSADGSAPSQPLHADGAELPKGGRRRAEK